MICRVWHGWTTKENADTYESLLRDEVFVIIGKRNIVGYKGIQLLRRELPESTEFMTIMWFESIGAIKIFAGEDYETPVIPVKARKLLSKFDSRSQHYEVKTESNH
jgi:hypothetical protein